MKRSSSWVVGSAVLLSGVLAAVSAGAPVASAAPVSGTVKVFVTPHGTTTTPKHPGAVVFTGAIGDYGTAWSANAAGKTTKKGTYRLLKLKKGTILVDITTFNKDIQSAFSSPSTFDATTCSIAIDVTTPITVVKGTKAYSGITGSITMTGIFAGISPRSKSGTCTTKTSTQPLATYVSLTGTGTVSVP